MEEAIKRRKIIHNFITKYSKRIVFDKKIRAINSIQRIFRRKRLRRIESCKIIQRFARKYILYNVMNIDNYQIDEIPGVYRYRTKIMNCIDTIEIDLMIDQQLKDVETIKDPDIKAVEKLKLEDFRQSMIGEIKKLNQTAGILDIPIMVDLRIYGDESSMKVNVNGTLYDIPQLEQDRIKLTYRKVNENEVEGHRFHQMLNWSKQMVKIYNDK